MMKLINQLYSQGASNEEILHLATSNPALHEELVRLLKQHFDDTKEKTGVLASQAHYAMGLRA